MNRFIASGTIQKHSLENTDAAIYGASANLNYFLNTTLTPDSADSVTVVQQSVKAHPRRRFVGDSTPASVGAHSREVVRDPGRRNGSATPGKPMILDDGTEKRSFTFTGPWTDVHSYLVGNAKMDLLAYSPSARYTIAAASNEGLKVL